jgi:hypothetical protein
MAKRRRKGRRLPGLLKRTRQPDDSGAAKVTYIIRSNPKVTSRIKIHIYVN